MPYINDSELDALFIDDETHLQEHTLLPPVKTFPLFTSLPAELRNFVYGHYMNDFHSTNPLRINASGSILLAPLTNTSRTIRHETTGYPARFMRQKISGQNLRIEAQIDSYDPTPLRTCLGALSTEFSVPEHELRSWTTVSFTGPFNLNNIIAWLRGPPLSNPFFKQKPLPPTDLSCFKDTGIFTGSLSVLYAMDQYLHLQHHAPAIWCRLATEFLEDAMVMGYASGYRRGELREADFVFEVIALWHHEVRVDFGAGVKKRTNAKALKLLRAKHADMASAVFAFWMKCAIV